MPQLPQLPELRQRLEAGARVAEVGRGEGWAAIGPAAATAVPVADTGCWRCYRLDR